MSFGRNPSGGQVKDEATFTAFAIVERDMVGLDKRIKSLENFRGNLANEIDRAIDVIDSTAGTAEAVRENLSTVLRQMSLNVKKL
jgi:hypothetical protein